MGGIGKAELKYLETTLRYSVSAQQAVLRKGEAFFQLEDPDSLFVLSLHNFVNYRARFALSNT